MASNYNRKSASSGSRRPASRAQASNTRRPAAPRQARTYERSGATRLTSVRVGDLPQVDRAARAQKTYHRYLARLGVVAGVIVALAIAATVACNSSLFTIESVSAKGVEHLTASDMQQLAGVDAGTTLLRVDTATIESNIMRDAWVENVHVQRVFPNTLNLAVTERTIGATVEIGVDDGKSTETWALSTDGIWLCRIPDKDSEAAQNISPKIYEDAENVFVITDVTYGVKPEVGKECTDESVKNALDVVTSLSTDLKDQVKQVSATSTENTTLTLDSNVEIAFGAASDVRDKERVIKQILADHPGEVSYINVRVVKSPTWRTA